MYRDILMLCYGCTTFNLVILDLQMIEFFYPDYPVNLDVLSWLHPLGTAGARLHRLFAPFL